MISCYSFGPMQTSLTRHMLLNCLYQDRKVSGHVYVWYGQHLCLYLQFCNWIIELFRQCGICCFSVRFQNCSDSMKLLVFLLDFRTVRTVWNCWFFCQILELYGQCGITCFFLLDFRTVPTVWYSLFFCYSLELY